MAGSKNFTSTWNITRDALKFKRMDIALMGGCAVYDKMVGSLRAYAKTYVHFLVPAPRPIELYMYFYDACDVKIWIVITVYNIATLFFLNIIAKYQRR